MCPECTRLQAISRSQLARMARDFLKKQQTVWVKAMTEKKDRERVIAEITLSHLIRLGNEQGCPVSRQQALAFLNQEGRAFEMWKHMMQAAEHFIADSLFQSFTPGTTDSHLGLGQSGNQHRLGLTTLSVSPSPSVREMRRQERPAQIIQPCV